MNENRGCPCCSQTGRKARWCISSVAAKIGTEAPAMQTYSCLNCGKNSNFAEEHKGSVSKEEPYTEVLSEEEFYKTFDALEESKTVLAALEIENGPLEWRLGAKESKKYHLASIESSKVALANLITIPAREYNKALFVDLCKMSETLKADRLYVALSKKAPQLANTVRSLTVYGFEKATPEEQKLFTSCLDITMLKIELTQEVDYVDL